MDGAVISLLPGFPLKHFMGRALQKGLIPPVPSLALFGTVLKGQKIFVEE